jgi:hypothetical protein
LGLGIQIEYRAVRTYSGKRERAEYCPKRVLKKQVISWTWRKKYALAELDA